MSADPPLHPRRIQAALEWLEDIDSKRGESSTVETCTVALKLLSKWQQKAGLSSDVVDVGARGFDLIKALTKIR